MHPKKHFIHWLACAYNFPLAEIQLKNENLVGINSFLFLKILMQITEAECFHTNLCWWYLHWIVIQNYYL